MSNFSKSQVLLAALLSSVMISSANAAGPDSNVKENFSAPSADSNQSDAKDHLKGHLKGHLEDRLEDGQEGRQDHLGDSAQ